MYNLFHYLGIIMYTIVAVLFQLNLLHASHYRVFVLFFFLNDLARKDSAPKSLFTEGRV